MPTNNTKIFKTVKKLDNGYLIQEMILTNEGQNLVENLNQAWLSQEWIASILTPYDTVKKTTTPDKKLVMNIAQYFKKEI